MDTADNLRIGVSFSGIPDSDGGEDEDGEEEEELFEAADNLDLGAVDLCVSTRRLYLKSFLCGQSLSLPARSINQPWVLPGSALSLFPRSFSKALGWQRFWYDEEPHVDIDAPL